MVPVVAAVISSVDNLEEILLVRRGPDQSGAGFWEFPGGKVENGETEIEALQREIQEELGLDLEVGSLVGTEIFDYGAKVIKLIVYRATVQNRKLVLSEHDDFKWLHPLQIDVMSLSPADRPFVSLLQN